MADDQEKGRGRNPMIDLLDHAARQSVGRERENTQRAEAK